MGTIEGGQQGGAVDLRIYLGAGEAGMAHQLLNGPQVAATCQKVRCKGMAQGMGRRALGQAKRRAHLFHALLVSPVRAQVLRSRAVCLP